MKKSVKRGIFTTSVIATSFASMGATSTAIINKNKLDPEFLEKLIAEIKAKTQEAIHEYENLNKNKDSLKIFKQNIDRSKQKLSELESKFNEYNSIKNKSSDVKKAINNFNESLSTLKDNISNAKTEYFQKVDDDIKLNINSANELIEKLNSNQDSVDTLQHAIVEAENKLNDFEDKLNNYDNEEHKNNETIRQNLDIFKEAIKTLRNEISKSNQKYTENKQTFDQIVENAKQTSNAAIKKLRETSKINVPGLEEAYNNLTIALNEVAEAKQKVKDSKIHVDNLTEVAQKVKNAENKVKDLLELINKLNDEQLNSKYLEEIESNIDELNQKNSEAEVVQDNVTKLSEFIEEFKEKINAAKETTNVIDSNSSTVTEQTKAKNNELKLLIPQSQEHLKAVEDKLNKITTEIQGELFTLQSNAQDNKQSIEENKDNFDQLSKDLENIEQNLANSVSTLKQKIEKVDYQNLFKPINDLQSLIESNKNKALENIKALILEELNKAQHLKQDQIQEFKNKIDAANNLEELKTIKQKIHETNSKQEANEFVKQLNNLSDDEINEYIKSVDETNSDDFSNLKEKYSKINEQKSQLISQINSFDFTDEHKNQFKKEIQQKNLTEAQKYLENIKKINDLKQEIKQYIDDAANKIPNDKKDILKNELLNSNNIESVENIRRKADVEKAKQKAIEEINNLTVNNKDELINEINQKDNEDEVMAVVAKAKGDLLQTAKLEAEGKIKKLKFISQNEKNKVISEIKQKNNENKSDITKLINDLSAKNTEKEAIFNENIANSELFTPEHIDETEKLLINEDDKDKYNKLKEDFVKLNQSKQDLKNKLNNNEFKNLGEKDKENILNKLKEIKFDPNSGNSQKVNELLNEITKLDNFKKDLIEKINQLQGVDETEKLKTIEEIKQAPTKELAQKLFDDLSLKSKKQIAKSEIQSLSSINNKKEQYLKNIEQAQNAEQIDNIIKEAKELDKQRKNKEFDKQNFSAISAHPEAKNQYNKEIEKANDSQAINQIVDKYKQWDNKFNEAIKTINSLDNLSQTAKEQLKNKINQINLDSKQTQEVIRAIDRILNDAKKTDQQNAKNIEILKQNEKWLPDNYANEIKEKIKNQTTIKDSNALLNKAKKLWKARETISKLEFINNEKQQYLDQLIDIEKPELQIHNLVEEAKQKNLTKQGYYLGLDQFKSSFSDQFIADQKEKIKQISETDAKNIFDQINKLHRDLEKQKNDTKKSVNTEFNQKPIAPKHKQFYLSLADKQKYSDNVLENLNDQECVQVLNDIVKLSKIETDLFIYSKNKRKYKLLLNDAEANEYISKYSNLPQADKNHASVELLNKVKPILLDAEKLHNDKKLIQDKYDTLQLVKSSLRQNAKNQVKNQTKQQAEQKFNELQTLNTEIDKGLKQLESSEFNKLSTTNKTKFKERIKNVDQVAQIQPIINEAKNEVALINAKQNAKSKINKLNKIYNKAKFTKRIDDDKSVDQVNQILNEAQDLNKTKIDTVKTINKLQITNATKTNAIKSIEQNDDKTFITNKLNELKDISDHKTKHINLINSFNLITKQKRDTKIDLIKKSDNKDFITKEFNSLKQLFDSKKSLENDINQAKTNNQISNSIKTKLINELKAKDSTVSVLQDFIRYKNNYAEHNKAINTLAQVKDLMKPFSFGNHITELEQFIKANSENNNDTATGFEQKNQNLHNPNNLNNYYNKFNQDSIRFLDEFKHNINSLSKSELEKKQNELQKHKEKLKEIDNKLKGTFNSSQRQLINDEFKKVEAKITEIENLIISKQNEINKLVNEYNTAKNALQVNIDKLKAYPIYQNDDKIIADKYQDILNKNVQSFNSAKQDSEAREWHAKMLTAKKALDMYNAPIDELVKYANLRARNENIKKIAFDKYEYLSREITNTMKLHRANLHDDSEYMEANITQLWKNFDTVKELIFIHEIMSIIGKGKWTKVTSDKDHDLYIYKAYVSNGTHSNSTIILDSPEYKSSHYPEMKFVFKGSINKEWNPYYHKFRGHIEFHSGEANNLVIRMDGEYTINWLPSKERFRENQHNGKDAEIHQKRNDVNLQLKYVLSGSKIAETVN
ncbi:Hypothetical protein, predicted transmembrane protein [Mycoplasmopsis bovigenitalium 51080]|uniref:Protein G-related albumin-binding (GA) module domain-containing protein n=1 Tax=Mycoplasmopsis bovigenitalium 51080 TaxID=1188235 RepID=N9VCQ3_9BACT|nr:GA module-containing protein [Mycoplasmopsis bovigenitalium]ENY69473.1 Hypothetical protein, predicted transmembrane protein [Mycoplasmopsis bovigenitalium 51080]